MVWWSIDEEENAGVVAGPFSSCLNHGCVRTNTAKLPSNSVLELIQVHAIHA